MGAWPTRTVWSSPHGVTNAATVATIAISFGSPRLSVIGPRTGSLVMVHPIPIKLKKPKKPKILNRKIHVLFFNLFKNKNQPKKVSFLPHKSLISNENNVTTLNVTKLLSFTISKLVRFEVVVLVSIYFLIIIPSFN